MKILKLLVKSIFLLFFVAISVGMPASAAVYNLETSMNGAKESPPNDSPGIGMGDFVLDNISHTLTVSTTFSGLNGTTTAAHIHCCTTIPGAGTAGVATQVPTFSGFPTGVTSGTYSNTFDLTLASSFNPAFITANGGTPATAEEALVNGILEGRAYLNIHSNKFGGGEIRGFLSLKNDGSIPEFPTVALPVIAVIGLMFLLQRRKGI